MSNAWSWMGGAVCAALLVVAPRCGAQTAPPASETPAAPAPWAAVPPPPVLAPTQAPQVALTAPAMVSVGPRDPHRGRRLLVMSLSGAAGALGGGFAGGLVGVALARPGEEWSALAGVVYGVTAGYLVGLPLGVTLAGHAQGGNGGYGWALLGCVGGSVALGGLAIVVAPDTSLPGVLGVAGGIAGAVVAYELSNDAQRSARPVATARVLPTAGVDATGLRLGLGGTF